MLDELLKENGIKGGCLRMYKEKFKQPNFKLWCVPTQQQRDSDPEHCPELFYDSKEVLPTHEWLPAVQQAYAEYEAQASSTKQKPIAEKVKALMNLLGKHICVRGKQFGISIQYVTTYVQQCQQHVDTQHACMPDLADTESELHFFFQPKAAVQRPPQLLLRPRKLQVEMKMDPMPDPEAESSRYVAVCRLPRNQCIEYAYDTGNKEQYSEACIPQEAMHACYIISCVFEKLRSTCCITASVLTCIDLDWLVNDTQAILRMLFCGPASSRY